MPHPALARFEAIDVRANGLRFRVRTAGQGDRLALLLHGFPETWFSWRDQIPALAALGYRVWAPDLRGYGESDRPRGVSRYRMDALVADVAGLVEASGAREVALIAHDWGGAVGWNVVERQAAKIDRFVALNMPHPRIYARHALRPGAQMRRGAYVYFFQLPFLPERLLARDDHHAIAAAFLSMAVDRSRFPPEVLDVYRAAAARPGALTAMLSYYRAAFREVGAMLGPAPAPIHTPTLLLWGEEDRAIGKELTLGTEDYVTDLTVRYVPRASHWLQQEAPEVVNALLAAFLQGRPVPEAFDLDCWRAPRPSGAART